MLRIFLSLLIGVWALQRNEFCLSVRQALSLAMGRPSDTSEGSDLCTFTYENDLRGSIQVSYTWATGYLSVALRGAGDNIYLTGDINGETTSNLQDDEKPDQKDITNWDKLYDEKYDQMNNFLYTSSTRYVTREFHNLIVAAVEDKSTEEDGMSATMDFQENQRIHFTFVKNLVKIFVFRSSNITSSLAKVEFKLVKNNAVVATATAPMNYAEYFNALSRSIFFLWRLRDFDLDNVDLANRRWNIEDKDFEIELNPFENPLASLTISSHDSDLMLQFSEDTSLLRAYNDIGLRTRLNDSFKENLYLRNGQYNHNRNRKAVLSLVEFTKLAGSLRAERQFETQGVIVMDHDEVEIDLSEFCISFKPGSVTFRRHDMGGNYILSMRDGRPMASFSASVKVDAHPKNSGSVSCSEIDCRITYADKSFSGDVLMQSPEFRSAVLITN